MNANRDPYTLAEELAAALAAVGAERAKLIFRRGRPVQFLTWFAPQHVRQQESSADLTPADLRVLEAMATEPQTAKRISAELGRHCSGTFYESLNRLLAAGKIAHRHGKYWLTGVGAQEPADNEDEKPTRPRPVPEANDQPSGHPRRRKTIMDYEPASTNGHARSSQSNPSAEER
jgi:hypothetical protein